MGRGVLVGLVTLVGVEWVTLCEKRGVALGSVNGGGLEQDGGKGRV